MNCDRDNLSPQGTRTKRVNNRSVSFVEKQGTERSIKKNVLHDLKNVHK